MRYEGVANGFRPVQAAGGRVLAERLLLHARADFGGVYFGAELEDSRNRLDDASTPLGTLSWSHSFGQFGGLVKVYSGC